MVFKALPPWSGPILTASYCRHSVFCHQNHLGPFKYRFLVPHSWFTALIILDAGIQESVFEPSKWYDYELVWKPSICTNLLFTHFPNDFAQCHGLHLDWLFSISTHHCFNPAHTSTIRILIIKASRNVRPPPSHPTLYAMNIFGFQVVHNRDPT